MTGRFTRIFAAALLMLATAAHAAPADEVKALLEQGKAADAWQLGRRHADLLGTPAFDLYFGIAAINAGKASEGVLALERFLFSAPDHAIARMELARGYFLLGEDARSREEFEALLARKPAPEVARVINEYLDALSARAARFSSSLAAWVELGGGHDGNVPSGVEDPNITLPVFGEITLADSAVKRSDRFLVASGGVRFSKPVTARVQAFAALSAEQRANREVDTFDQELFAGALGLNWQWSERGVVRATYSLTTQTIDHQKYRDSSAISIELGQQLGESTTGMLGFQTANFRHGGFNGVRDADYDALSLGFRHRPAVRWRPELDASFSVAREKALLADRQDLSRDLTGGRLGISCSPLPSWTFSLAGQWLRSDYQAPDPLLLETRRDRYTAAELGVNWTPGWQWARNASLRLELSHATNKSNLALYEYKRRAVTVKLRHDFK